MASFVTHLEAALDGTRLEARVPQTLHPPGPQGRPLWVRYDLDAVRAAVDRDALARRPSGLWRYRELLPVDDDAAIVSLGETTTPLLDCPRLAAAVGVRRLTVKDESRLPTGSFKARGMALAISMAKQFGITRVALPSAGNAGGAAAAYAAKAGMDCWVLMPDDAPVVNRLEAALFGAHVFVLDGLIDHCGAVVREGVERLGWFDLSTLKEPYRIEGKKTMGLELAEQLHWSLPDVIVYPTGGGTGLIGMAKAFDELRTLSWLQADAAVRFVSAQAAGCAPIATAYQRGERFAERTPEPVTAAAGLRVPAAVGDFMILDAVRRSGGVALTADESCIHRWMEAAGRLEGLSLCPESAVALGVLERALAAGHVAPDEHVVLFNTGAAQKSLEVLEAGDRPQPRLCRANLDWSALESAAPAPR